MRSRLQDLVTPITHDLLCRHSQHARQFGAQSAASDSPVLNSSLCLGLFLI